jgi:tetratricopeptide (TPR) repeat protein
MNGTPMRSSSTRAQREQADQQCRLAHNYAATLGDLERWPEALAAVNRALATGLNAPETWLVKARSAEQRRSRRCRSCVQQAIKRRPDYAEAQRDYAQYAGCAAAVRTWRMRDCGEPSRPHPDNAALAIVLANVLEFSGRPQAAYDELRSRLAHRPAMSSSCSRQRMPAGLIGDDAAALAHAEAAGRAPNTRPRSSTLHCLSGGRRPPRALAAARRRLAQEPAGQMPLALTAVAARLAGDPEHDRIYDFDAFVRTACLETPEGWSDLASYLADLKAALERLHVFRRIRSTSRCGEGRETTQPLLYSEDPAIKAFFRAIDAPIRDYMAAIGTGDDPLRSRNTKAPIASGRLVGPAACIGLPSTTSTRTGCRRRSTSKPQRCRRDRRDSSGSDARYSRTRVLRSNLNAGCGGARSTRALSVLSLARYAPFPLTRRGCRSLSTWCRHEAAERVRRAAGFRLARTGVDVVRLGRIRDVRPPARRDEGVAARDD